MKKKIYYLSLGLMMLAMVGCMKKDIQPAVQDVSTAPDATGTLKSASLTKKYIVVMKKDANVAASDDKNFRNSKVKEKGHGLLTKHAMKDQIGEVYETALQGFTAELTADQVKELGADPAVKYIEENQIITLSKDEAMKSAPVVTKLTDAVPWGVARVGGGDKEYKGKNAAWIIDTGIDFSHPDLNVGTEDAKSFVPHEESPQDVRGHGTMVAGIIGAIKGNGGILGVAPGVKVIPVKIFRADGYSDLEIVIAAINYVAEEASSGDVANLSFSLVPYTDEQGIYHDGTSQALDDAVLDASSSKKKSIDFTIAAGNDYDNAGLRSPARVNGEHIYTVSAMSQKDLWAPWSNFGNPPIDYCAPGVDIASTWPYDVAKDPLDPNIIPGYNIRSGTSFAAPHVAGLLLLGKIKDGGHVIGDPDGNPDIIAVNKK